MKKLTTILMLLMLATMGLGILSCSQKTGGATGQEGTQAEKTREERLEEAREQIIEMSLSGDPRFQERLDSVAEAVGMVPEEVSYWLADYYSDRLKHRLALMYVKKAIATDRLLKESPYRYYRAIETAVTTYYNTGSLSEGLDIANRGYQETRRDTSLMGQNWTVEFLGHICTFQRQLHHDKEADATFQKAVGLAEALAAAHPENPDVHASEFLAADRNFGFGSDNQEGVQRALHSLDIMERALQRFAETNKEKEHLEYYRNLYLLEKATLYYNLGRKQEAAAAYHEFTQNVSPKDLKWIELRIPYLKSTGQWDEALRLYAKMDSINHAEGVPVTFEYLVDYPKSIFEALMKTGRKGEALKKATQIIQLMDSARANQYKSDAEELAVIYETQQKEEQIALQQSELSRQRYVSAGLLLGALVVAVVVWLLMRLRSERRMAALKAEQERIENELKIARDIQMSMVPSTFPEREGLDMYASMTPAKEVGGDLYGYVLQDDKLYFAVGDVSGKGVPASLFMAQATRLFRTLAAQGMMPAEICTRMNDALSGEDNVNGMFVTFFLGLIDLTTGHMDFCNAGHNPPVIGGGEQHGEFLEMVPNAPIGLWPGLEYEGEAIENVKGRPLFIYTDGLNEAENREQQQFSDERLLSILQQTQFENACQVIETLAAEVEKHRNGADPNDDLTMMCIKV